MNRGNVDSSGDREVTTRGVYVANKRNVANLTHTYIDDGGVFSPNLLTAGFAQSILPTVPVVNDAIYFGIDTSVTDSGPFNSLIFDVATPAIYPTTAAIIWEYWNGGSWVTNTVADFTSEDDTGVASWTVSGVGIIRLSVPSDWATTSVNSVTAYWMRARVTNIGTGITSPTQQNRHVYSAVWPYVEVQEDSIGGDINALLKYIIKRKSRTSYTLGKVFVATRQVARGDLFTPVINMAQSQNPDGVTVAANVARAAFANDLNSPVGEVLQTVASGTYRHTMTITLDSTLSRHYYGKFVAFVRYNMPIMTGDVEIKFGLQYQVGSDGAEIDNSSILTHGSLAGPSSYKISNLGVVNINPALLSGYVDQITFNLFSSSFQAIDTVDFWLMPIDEQTVDIEILKTVPLKNGAVISDNISDPKRFIGYSIEDGVIITPNKLIDGGLSTAREGDRYRIYTLGLSKSDVLGDLTSVWKDDYSVDMDNVQRYLSMRGDS